jgi:hypothetical protein
VTSVPASRDEAPIPDVQPEDSPLYDAWVVIANARDWHLHDQQAREWVAAAQRWRDANGFGVSS